MDSFKLGNLLFYYVRDIVDFADAVGKLFYFGKII